MHSIYKMYILIYVANAWVLSYSDQPCVGLSYCETGQQLAKETVTLTWRYTFEPPWYKHILNLQAVLNNTHWSIHTTQFQHNYVYISRYMCMYVHIHVHAYTVCWPGLYTKHRIWSLHLRKNIGRALARVILFPGMQTEEVLYLVYRPKWAYYIVYIVCYRQHLRTGD